jgi:hypothetical protein
LHILQVNPLSARAIAKYDERATSTFIDKIPLITLDPKGMKKLGYDYIADV